MSKYRTIVADPPWPHGRTTPKNARCEICGKRKINKEGYRCTCVNPRWRALINEMPYATMTLGDIAALPVDAIAERDAHLYLWTTQMFLRDAYDIVKAWGFGRPSSVLVWSKSPKGLSRSAFVCSAEFVLFARRGTLASLDRQMGTVFEWPRMGATGVQGTLHSAKPDAFLDMVERMSPEPRLEMFARRSRLSGWDYWGDESLGTAEMPEAV